MIKKEGERVKDKLLVLLDREYPDPMHISAIAARLGSNRAYISNIIPRLIEKGLVERTSIGYYRRVKW